MPEHVHHIVKRLILYICICLHRQLRDWMYAGDIWHPLLMDLSLFALSVCLALVLLIAW